MIRSNSQTAYCCTICDALYDDETWASECCDDSKGIFEDYEGKEQITAWIDQYKSHYAVLEEMDEALKNKSFVVTKSRLGSDYYAVKPYAESRFELCARSEDGCYQVIEEMYEEME